MKVRRPNRDAGTKREVYDGTRHTGSVAVLIDGYRAQSIHSPKSIGTFNTEAEANRAIFDADCAMAKGSL